jgi:tetratricopeptide (TPR) repeat protein
MRLDAILVLTTLPAFAQTVVPGNRAVLKPLLTQVEANIAGGRQREKAFDYTGALAAYQSAIQLLDEQPSLTTGIIALSGTPSNSYATFALLKSGLELDCARVKSLRGDSFSWYQDNLLLCQGIARLIVGETGQPPAPFGQYRKKVWNESPTPAHKLYAYLNLAQSHIMLGEFREAADDFSKARVIDPKNSEAVEGWSFAREHIPNEAPSKDQNRLPTRDYQMMVDTAINIGKTFFTKRFPMGAPIVAEVLTLINHLYPDLQKSGQ